ncbi:hypothetical protein EYF80_062216 [Liparis tanakae]|uniref:Uncharacterized protein n=1 Tax=Liparis tanakae TaxID=230148 RepID=A0A4Z2EFW7_9TELE|nr:hypothetical protein EYF80_062216 [Liparis tanakae]
MTSISKNNTRSQSSSTRYGTFGTHFPVLPPPLMPLNSSSSELESDSESGGSVRSSRCPVPFLVFFLLLSPSPMRAFSSFLFFIFFCGVSEPAEPELNPAKSKVLASLVVATQSATPPPPKHVYLDDAESQEQQLKKKKKKKKFSQGKRLSADNNSRQATHTTTETALLSSY